MAQKVNLADLREDYQLATLTLENADQDALLQFDRWMEEAVKAGTLEPNAMTLATVTDEGIPDARIVLLKDVEDGAFVFYTNYNSAKAQQIDANGTVCLTFLWKAMQRQVRIIGIASKVSAEVSDAYFASRPRGSRIGAWVSPQSEVIASRAVLDESLAELETTYADTEDIPRPLHWGGYAVVPTVIEFWQGRSSRLHDRLLYTKVDGYWSIDRLAP